MTFFAISATLIAKTQDQSSVLRKQFPYSREVNCTSRSSHPLHTHGDAHPSSDAQRGHAPPSPCPLQSVQQRHQHPAAGHSDGVSQRDGAAADVDLQEEMTRPRCTI